MVERSRPLLYNENTPEDFDKYIVKRESCHLWNGPLNTEGYGDFYCGGKVYKAHRYAWERKYGPTTLYVLHSCDVTNCVNLEHLHLGTHADNMREASERNLLPSGMQKPNARLTDDAVRYIRKNYAPYHPEFGARPLARKFGVTHTQVLEVAYYKTWRKVAKEAPDDRA